MGYSFLTEKFSKNWIRGIFLLENGQVIFKTCKYGTDMTFTIGKCAYIVDKERMHFEKSTPYLMYFENNPNPIVFKNEKMLINGKAIASESFYDILNTKVIKEMVSSGAEEKLIMILLIIVIALGILNLAASAGLLTPQAANATANMTANMTAVPPIR